MKLSDFKYIVERNYRHMVLLRVSYKVQKQPQTTTGIAL